MDKQTIETILQGIIAKRLPDVSPESILTEGEAEYVENRLS